MIINRTYQHLQTTTIVGLTGNFIAIYAYNRKRGESKINDLEKIGGTKKARKTRGKQQEGNYKNKSAEAEQMKTEKKENQPSNCFVTRQLAL